MSTVLDCLIECDKTSLEIINLLSVTANKPKSVLAGIVFSELARMRDDEIVKQLENNKWSIISE